MKNIGKARTLSVHRKVLIRKRFGERCVYCLAKQARQVDHVINFNDGGTDDEENLQLLCDRCNAKIKRYFWTFQAIELVNARKETAEINNLPINYEQEKNKYLMYYEEKKQIREPRPWYLTRDDGSPILIEEFSFNGMIGLQAIKAFYNALDNQFDRIYNQWASLRQEHNQGNNLTSKKENYTKK